MLWPLSCGSSSCVSTWLRATLAVAWTGCTQPSSSPSPCVASSASLLPWQPANHLVREEPDTEGQSLSSNITTVFQKWDLIRSPFSMTGVCSHCLDQQTSSCSLCEFWQTEDAVYNPLSVFVLSTSLFLPAVCI